MPTVFALRDFNIRTWFGKWALPCTCHMCGQWQSQPLCIPCITRWQGQATRCQRCAIALRPPLTTPDAICQLCEDHSPEFDRAIAAFDYVAPWKQVLASFKFQENIALAQPLSALLAETIRQRPHRVDLILPTPLSEQRLKERGFNQTWLLAQALARQLHIPARHDVLQRTRHTERLMSLDADARKAHIAGAFSLNPSNELDVLGRHVAIVDDVLTTGATMNEAAATLHRAGAKSVSAWVLARTPSQTC